jgi:hypothetical protein
VADDLDVSSVFMCRASTAYLVITLVGSSELTDEPDQDQFSNLRQLGVDNGDKGGEYRCKWQRRSLGTHDGSTKQPFSSNQVLAK